MKVQEFNIPTQRSEKIHSVGARSSQLITEKFSNQQCPHIYYFLGAHTVFQPKFKSQRQEIPGQTFSMPPTHTNSQTIALKFLCALGNAFTDESVTKTG